MKINIEPILPIRQIGEDNWIENLTCFLEDHDVEVISLETENFQKTEKYLDWIIPSQTKDYFLHFGGIESSDFMYNLKKMDKWEALTNSIWEFVSLHFQQEETDKYIVFSESPSNDPICFKRDTGEIYLFSHDPIKRAKVYKDFNDYLLNEIIEIQKLYAEVSFDSSKEEIEYKENLLDGVGIDFDFRYLKL
ncbi:SMI1/KNR4 family protein [Paenibacillus sp. MER TA 81-3]|uniref:SMI1/KNR4 family protein n=1 Tax=Paenibacillus sp. MER TA 81-3 TaxID=2939573 RepID=UPI00203CA7FB|nr:SMI1/KNR4 family protein [Paenibacillus sp. MER TA 81-3]MCM3342710.1 SMI1/KNR4 family protein [Paenibacillus sp. MER TA 81-3]